MRRRKIDSPPCDENALSGIGVPMSRTIITSVHREILQLVRSFNGLYGPLGREAAAEALSRFPRMSRAPFQTISTRLSGADSFA